MCITVTGRRESCTFPIRVFWHSWSYQCVNRESIVAVTKMPSPVPTLVLMLTLGDSRTNTGDDSSDKFKQRLLGQMGSLRQSNRILSTLDWYIGKFKLLTGIAALGTATAILAIAGKRSNDNGNSGISLRIAPLILAVFSLLFMTNRHVHAPKNATS